MEMDPDGRYNMIICNPPYVRHHPLLANAEKRKSGRGPKPLRALGCLDWQGFTATFCYSQCSGWPLAGMPAGLCRANSWT
jgi:hypothetical protein